MSTCSDCLSGGFQLGDWRVEPEIHEICDGERRIHLEPKVMAVLVYLAERSYEVVAKEEILSAVWSGVAVSEISLPRSISDLRRALGDDAREPRYIETIPKKGYRLIAEVSREPEPREAAPTAHRSKRFLLAAASLLVMGLGAAWGFANRPSTAPRDSIESLAVLPLRDLSVPQQEYFADAMTDLLITDLAKLDMARVTSGTSVMRYKERRPALPEIAAELGVDAVIEGTILRTSGRVRITVQLIDGRSDEHLWAESYERREGDMLALQSEVAKAIARSIRLSLHPERLARLDRRAQIDPAAYELYLKGRERFQHRWQTKEKGGNLVAAIDFYRRSLALEPQNPLAYAGLADAYMLLADTEVLPRGEALRDAKRSALKALRLDPDLAETHVALAMIRYLFELDWYSADFHFRRGVELDPSYATGRQWYAMFLASMGRFDEAVAEADLATRLDPFSAQTRLNAARAYYLSRRYDRALAEYEKVRSIDPKSHYDDYPVTARLARERTPETLAAFLGSLNECKDGQPQADDSCGCAYGAALRHAVSGEIERAVDCLRRAAEERQTVIVDIASEPLFASLHEDPGFLELLAELDLAG